MELKIEHQTAAHCENGAISTLLRFNGVNLSEPMIFGLASGLYFVHPPFLKMSGMPVTSFRTFPGVLFKRVTRLLGIKTATRRFLNEQRAMETLDRVLTEEGKPVGCVVGMYYLSYLPIEYRFHFNGHNICVTGKDETTGDYTINDSVALKIVTVSAKELRKVRFAKGGTYPVMGQMYWIKSVPKTLPDLRPLIIRSIKKTCRTMAFQPRFIPFLGTNGIFYLSKRIRHWEQSMGKRRAMLNLAQLVRMQEEIGTGGAGFRFIYGAFLQEAATLTGISKLNDYAVRITEIGDMWREFAYKASKIYKQRGSEHYTYDDLGDILQVIGKKEQCFFLELYELVTKTPHTW